MDASPEKGRSTSGRGKETALLEALSAYVPMDRLQAMVAGRDLAAHAEGAVLFADISGFTPLTEAIEKDLGPRRGGEELTRHLNAVYGGLIGEVDRSRGSVIGFSGDAITCWFDGDDGTRAASCGLRLQEVMRNFGAVPTPSGTTLSLAIKVAVTSGAARRLVVGDRARQALDVLSGTLLDRVAQAEHAAGAGELIVGEEVVAAAGARAKVAAWRLDDAGHRFAVVSSIEGEPDPEPWPPIDVAKLGEAQLRPWLLPAVYGHLHSGQGDFLAELRPAVALFLRFGGLDFEGDRHVDEKLDAYIRWTQGVLDHYAGSLIQLTTGDKGSYLYAVFGAPSGDEHMVVHALSAALSLRSPPPELAFIEKTQIGLSSGRMRTGAYGSERRRTYGVLGDETNLAARLMSRAAPGQILVSKRIADAAGSAYRFEPLGTVTLKGKKPLPLFELQGLSERTGRAARRRSRDPIVGRRDERAFLHAAFDDLHAGRANPVVIIEGEAGIGKTRLLGDLLDHARTKTEPTVACIIAATDPIERSTAYYAWRTVFAGLLGIDGLTDPDALRAHVLERIPASLLPVAPLLNTLLEFDLPETATSAQLQGNMRAVQTQRFLATLFRALAGDGPLLFVLEDAHWLDSSSWTLLDRIRRDAPAFMLATTTRPMDEPPPHYLQLRQGTNTRFLLVDAMPPDDAIALVSRRLGVSGLPEPVAALIRDKAEGNPFFTEELAFALRDAGLIRIEGGECHVEQALDALSFPDTIEGVVTSRIDRLSPSQQLTLKVASVVGRAFKCATLQDVFPVQEERNRLPDFLSTLAQLDITPREGADFVFKHAVTLEVTYNLMLFEQRRTLHGVVADWYERVHAEDLTPFYGLLAHHRSRAIEGLAQPGEARSKQAITALLRAGKQSLATGATPEAMSQLSRGVALLDVLPESRERSVLELDLRAALGAALVVGRGPTHEEVRHEFGRMRQLCQELGETSRLFDALFGIWYSHLTSSERAGSIEFSSQLLDVARESKNPAFLFLANQARGATSVCAGNPVEGLEHMQTALAIAKDASFTGALAQARNPLVMAHCYCAWAHWLLGYPDRAVIEVETAIQMAAEVAHPLTLTQALSFGALVGRYRRDPVMAEKYVARASALANEHNYSFWIGVVSSVRGWLAIHRGELEAAIVQLKTGMARDREAGVFPLSSINVLVDLVDAFTRLGRFDEAMTVIEEARAMTVTRLTGFAGADIHRLEGELWRRRGDDDRAEACLVRSFELARSQDALSLALRAAISLSRLWHAQGKPATQPLAEIYEWFREGKDTADLAEAAHVLREVGVASR